LVCLAAIQSQQGGASAQKFEEISALDLLILVTHEIPPKINPRHSREGENSAQIIVKSSERQREVVASDYF
jgi:hypothetical protein